jgi:DNA-binding transcriptional LysR family regulator
LRVALFSRDHQKVVATYAGRGFVQESKLALLHLQRAIQAARSIANGAEAVLNFGQSPYVDPFLTSIISSVHLPLYPDLRVHIFSDYSPELSRRVSIGELDMALVVAGSESSELASVELKTSPLYIVFKESSPLANHKVLKLGDLDGLLWILFAQQVNPALYRTIDDRAKLLGVRPSECHHVVSEEQAAQLVLRNGGVAFLSEHGAWKVAVDSLTLRPLEEPDVVARTVLTARNDANRLVSEFLRAVVKKAKRVSRPTQGTLSLAG